MALPWDDVKRLMRMQGIADELLNATRNAHDADTAEAVGAQLDTLMKEVHALLSDRDAVMADEFTRMVMTGDLSVPAEVRAAAFVGWLKAGLAAEAYEGKRKEQDRGRTEPPRRKQTVGFKIRSPLTRETKQESSAEPPPAPSG